MGTYWQNLRRAEEAAAREAAEAEERAERSARWQNLYNVPERARDEYMAMEDNFCPATVLDFMLAMHPEEE